MRAVDWDVALAGVIAAAQARGWGWDGATCLHLMVDAAEAVAPGAPVRDVASALAGGAMPRTRRGLLRALSRLGGLESAVEQCAARCRWPEIDPARAASGDWGVTHHCGQREKTGLAEGVVRMGDNWVYRLPEVGLTQLPASVAPVTRAWAVG
jgi:hypothetical protein